MHWTKVCEFFSFPIKVFILFFFLHRFAETEGTAVLVMLVSKYRISIKEEPQFVGERFEENQEFYPRILE